MKHQRIALVLLCLLGCFVGLATGYPPGTGGPTCQTDTKLTACIKDTCCQFIDQTSDITNTSFIIKFPGPTVNLKSCQGTAAETTECLMPAPSLTQDCVGNAFIQPLISQEVLTACNTNNLTPYQEETCKYPTCADVLP